MGLIKEDGAVIKGVFIRPAYAKVLEFYTRNDEDMEHNKIQSLVVTMGISSNRDNIDRDEVLCFAQFAYLYDRNSKDLFGDIYREAKNTDVFAGWDDDIIEPKELSITDMLEPESEPGSEEK